MTTDGFPRLEELIRQHSWTPHWKVITCAPDVERALSTMSVKARTSSLPIDPEAAIAALMGISVIVSEDSAPGTWQLVRHDHCQVVQVIDDDGHMDPEKSMVTHQECTILGRSGE